MSVINTEIKPFKASAFKAGKFIDITEKDVLGKWAVFVFYPADFTFVCPTELGDVADHYAEFQKMGVEIRTSTLAIDMDHESITVKGPTGVETIRTHVAAVLRKLGARDRTHAVVLAYGLGLVDLHRS